MGTVTASGAAVSNAAPVVASTLDLHDRGRHRAHASSWGTSLVLHAIVLSALALLRYSVATESDVRIDTIFTDERTTEEFEREVETTTDVAESLNVLGGGAAVNSALSGTGGGGTGVSVEGSKLASAESLKVPTVPVSVGSISIPGDQLLTDDLGSKGDGKITGDVGRVVDGYGTALSQISQELIRMMREERVLAVWLFDESESMRDDQREIRDRFDKIYQELRLAQETDQKLKASEEVILTSIMSFGQSVTELTQKPTADLKEIRAAIDKVGLDESGKENTCNAITQAIRKYQTFAQRQKRKLVTIVVSDESGDDGDLIEETIQTAQRSKAPIYVLGRYSVFGYPYARQRWIDPKYGLEHWLAINRGPESPFPELLQFDGLHERWDYDSAGFGPYEQARLARETGGIFFLLPGSDDNIVHGGTIDDRKFEMLAMKEYLPDLSARVEYARERDSSKFRSVQFQVVMALNPHKNPDLQMQEIWYSADPEKFANEGRTQFTKALKAMQMLSEAVRLLDSVAPLRAKEPSQRWRANFDLMHAQCLAYRVRLFQFLLALDQHAKQNPPRKPPNNVWNIQRVPEMLPPDPVQVEQTRVDLDELKKEQEQAVKEFQAVIDAHPGTPWARRAQIEINQGFGIKMYDVFRDPRYDNLDIKLPTL